MAIELSNPKDCRSAYREVLQGYTFSEEGGFYIKHFREADLGFIDSIYKECSKSLEKMGVFTSKEKLAFLREEEYWTQKEEESYTMATLAVKDAHEFLSKIIDPEQKENFEKTMVPEAEENLKKIQKERSELLEPTIETICNKRLNEFYVYHALYKDKELKEPYYSKEEFDELSYFELGDLVGYYNNETSKFSEKNLKKIAVNYFFLNSFFMADDDPVKFYGNNILNLTMYQMNIFSRGKFYKSVLVEGKDPPEQFLEEGYVNGLQEMVDWYQGEHNRIQHERDMKAQHHRSRGGR